MRITLVADPGFGDQQLYAHLACLGIHFIIRFRQDILGTDANGLKQPARAWVPANHRARSLPGAAVTQDQYPVGAVVLIHDKNMAESWCRASLRPRRSKTREWFIGHLQAATGYTIRHPY